eukprot:IDg23888t1
MLLQISVKAMNDTLGPEGLVPSALVFVEFPKFLTRSEAPNPRITLSDRSKVARAALYEMQGHIAKMRVNLALNHSVPNDADCSMS